MDITKIEASLGIYDPIRAKRWEHFIKDENGKRRPDVVTDFQKYTVEQLLDNTIGEAMDQFGINRSTYSIADVHKAIHESTTNASPGIATFLKFAFPLVRRIWAKSIGKNLVGVQPMKLPTAKVFTLDHIRNTGGTRLDDRSVAGARSYANDPGELGTPIRELNIKISSDTVDASTKKIKAVHSIEVGQDLMAYHGISINSELMDIMATEISLEIDKQIIYDLVTGATAGNVTWSSTPPNILPTEVEAYKKTIKDAFISASNLIFANIYRDANFIVSDISGAERLEKLGEYDFKKAPDEGVSSFGRKFVGTLYGQYQVYKDPFFPVPGKYLVGYKGSSWLDTGYVYCPYVPYMTVPQFVNPDNFSVTKAAMSRQGYFMKNGNNYATVEIISS